MPRILSHTVFPTLAAVLIGCTPRVDPARETIGAQVINAYCPITGTHVGGEERRPPSDWTRRFNGRSVGFCCADCPAEWDRLSDEERAASLNEALTLEQMPR